MPAANRRRPASTYWIGDKQVTRAQWNRQCKGYRGGPIRRAHSVRGRKAAVLARRPLQGCEHDYLYREDWDGDPGVVNGTWTYGWLECATCGAKAAATDADRDAAYAWDVTDY